MTSNNDCIVLGDSSDDDCLIIDEIPSTRVSKRFEKVDEDIFIINHPIKSKKQRLSSLKTIESTGRNPLVNTCKDNNWNLPKRKTIFTLTIEQSLKPKETLRKQKSNEAITFEKDREIHNLDDNFTSLPVITTKDVRKTRPKRDSKDKQDNTEPYEIIKTLESGSVKQNLIEDDTIIIENIATPSLPPVITFLSPIKDSQSLNLAQNSFLDSPESTSSINTFSPKDEQEKYIEPIYDSISHYLLSNHFKIDQFKLKQNESLRTNSYIYDVINANLNIRSNDLLNLNDALGQAIRFLENSLTKNSKIDVFDMYQLFNSLDKLEASKELILKKFEKLVKHVNLDFSIECNRTLNLWEVINKRLDDFIFLKNGLNYNSIEFNCFYELYLRFSLKVLNEFLYRKKKQQKNWLQSLNQYKELQDKYNKLYNEKLYTKIFDLIELTFLKNQSSIYYRDLQHFLFKLDNLTFVNYLFINVFNNGIVYENIIFDKYLPLYKKVYDNLTNIEHKFYYLNSIIQLDEIKYKLSDTICNSMSIGNDTFQHFKSIIDKKNEKSYSYTEFTSVFFTFLKTYNKFKTGRLY